MTDRCPERELLSAYVDREANPSEERRVGLHLADCGACRAQVRSLARLKTAVRNQPLPPIPAELRASLRRLAADADRAGLAARWREAAAAWLAPGASRWGLALAAALLALGLAARRFAGLRPAVPVDLLLAAHSQYVRTMPLAETDTILSDLPSELGGAAGDERRDVY